jgi:hypothetical protein
MAQQTWLLHGRLLWPRPMWTTLATRTLGVWMVTCLYMSTAKAKLNNLFIPCYIYVVFACFLLSLLLCACRNWFFTLFPFPVTMWHIYIRFPSFWCRPLTWVVISEVRTIVPKYTIPSYSYEVRGEIRNDFGIGNTCLALWGCWCFQRDWWVELLRFGLDLYF